MIKKTLFYLNAILLLAVAAIGTSCDDEKCIEFGDLPQSARHFVETYFGGIEITSAVRDKDDGRTTYELRLADGTEIDFNENGEWENIDCPFSTLPDGILPQAIAGDIATRYPDARLHGAERAIGGYIIDLNKADGTPLEVRYSAAGDYIGEQIDY